MNCRSTQPQCPDFSLFLYLFGHQLPFNKIYRALQLIPAPTSKETFFTCQQKDSYYITPLMLLIP